MRRDRNTWKNGNISAGATAGTAGTAKDAYTYLREVWYDELQPVHVRMRAAAVGIEYEMPRLAVTAAITGDDFGAVLDRRIKHMAELEQRRAQINSIKMIEAPTKTIEMPKLNRRRI